MTVVSLKKREEGGDGRETNGKNSLLHLLALGDHLEQLLEVAHNHLCTVHSTAVSCRDFHI